MDEFHRCAHYFSFNDAAAPKYPELFTLLAL